MKSDPRVDAYIDRAAAFAKPILRHLRETVHAACPECEEATKWSSPAFIYKGKILAGMSAFKAHASFAFWHGQQVADTGGKQMEAMGQFGRLTSIDDLPPRAELEAMVKKAMALVDQGVKPPRNKHEKAPLAVPQDLQAALDANAAARETFDGFPPSAQREYVDWVSESKRDETRAKRLAQTIEWLAEGKRRHWKYQNC